MEYDNRRPRRALLIVIIWLLFTLSVGVLGYPRVKAAFADSGVGALLSKRGEAQGPTTATRAVRVAFVLPDGKMRIYPIRFERLGGSLYHDTFEALLAGSPLSALSDGAVSYIDAKTRLRGVTVSNAILFVDFSAHYLASTQRDLADEQVKATALAQSGIKAVVILVDGSPIG